MSILNIGLIFPLSYSLDSCLIEDLVGAFYDYNMFDIALLIGPDRESNRAFKAFLLCGFRVYWVDFFYKPRRIDGVPGFYSPLFKVIQFLLEL